MGAGLHLCRLSERPIKALRLNSCSLAPEPHGIHAGEGVEGVLAGCGPCQSISRLLSAGSGVTIFTAPSGSV